MREDPGVINAITVHLTEQARTPIPKFSSHFIGPAGASLVSAMGAALSPALDRLFSPTLRRWAATCDVGREEDVYLGTAGALLAAAEIQEYRPGGIAPDFVKGLHRRSAAALGRLIARSEAEPICLGMAHGVAGYVLALEASSAAFGFRFASALRAEALSVLEANRLEATSTVSAWPRNAGENDVGLHSWCHAGPGIGLALICCWRLAGRREYLRLASPALHGTFRLSSNAASTFCCGLAGRAQILIEAFRITRDRAWMRRAESLADGVRVAGLRARRGHPFVRGFGQGRLGIDYLQWRRAYPTKLPLLGLGALSS